MLKGGGYAPGYPYESGVKNYGSYLFGSGKIPKENPLTALSWDGGQDGCILNMTVLNEENKLDLSIPIKLPETGGIGTLIFYVIGGIIVVVAVILLITRHRMRKEEQFS